jgi:hypothetical protein
MSKPLIFKMDDGEVLYKCRECGFETDSEGQCSDETLPCHYCPPWQCKGCKRGDCDLSC